jgi:hypothetical protein
MNPEPLRTDLAYRVDAEDETERGEDHGEPEYSQHNGTLQPHTAR